VILLLPSLMFSASVLAGPFIMTPLPGRPSGPLLRILPWFAWPAAFVFYATISMLVARGGPWQILATLLALMVGGAFLADAGRHFLHPLQLRRHRRRLHRQLRSVLPDPVARQMLVSKLLAQATNPTQLRSLLQSIALPQIDQDAIVAYVQGPVLAQLQQPARFQASRSPRWERLAADFRRTFTIALLTLLWFFVVPVPGLFVLTAGDYRTSLALASIAGVGLAAVVLTLLGHSAANGLSHLRRRFPGPGNFEARTRSVFSRFLSRLGAAPSLPHPEVSRLGALFTDLKTYVDQQAESRVRTCLDRIERALPPRH
jgi:hypothetical protein